MIHELCFVPSVRASIIAISSLRFQFVISQVTNVTFKSPITGASTHQLNNLYDLIEQNPARSKIIELAESYVHKYVQNPLNDPAYPPDSITFDPIVGATFLYYHGPIQPLVIVLHIFLCLVAHKYKVVELLFF